MMVGQQRIVIHRLLIILFSVIPPRIENGAMATSVNQIVEAQTEPRTANSMWPDLGVLAVDAFRPF